MSKKIDKKSADIKNVKDGNENKTYTPFYYYIIRYGIFLIPCLALLIFGIFLVNYGWSRAKETKSQEQAVNNETTEQISNNENTELVGSPKTVSEMQESGTLKLSADFAFKLRDLKTKLTSFDASLLNDEEKQKLNGVMNDFEIYLDTLGTKTPEEATNELTLLSARVDELNAIIDFRSSESEIYGNYEIDIPNYEDYVNSETETPDVESETAETEKSE